MSECNAANGAALNRLADMVPLSMPLSLTVSCGNVCNLKCNYCYHGSPQKMQDLVTGNYKAKFLDRDLVDLIVAQSKGFNGRYKQATIVGSGEPLANRDIVYAVREFKSIAERVKIVTNATLLTDELSLALIDAGLDLLKISFQGMTNQKYKEICGTDIDVDKLIEQIEFFYKHKRNCQIHIKVVDTALDDGEEDLFYERLGAVSDLAWIEKLSEVDVTGRWIDGTNRWSETEKNVEVCYFPFYYIDIDENGYFYPCCNATKGMELGNIYDKPINELWQTEVSKLCMAQLKGSIESYTSCIGCNVVQAMYRKENDLDDGRAAILKRMVERDF